MLYEVITVRMVQFAPASKSFPEPQAAPGGSLEEPSIQDLLGTTGYSGTETDSVPEDSVESPLPEDSEPVIRLLGFILSR